MKTSTEIYSIVRHVGYEKAVELVAKAGFDAWDLSMFNMLRYDWSTGTTIETGDPLEGSDYVNFVKRLRRIGEDNGIHCNQSHAPFPVHCSGIKSYLKRAIECTAIAGGEICIIHPNCRIDVKGNAEMYLTILVSSALLGR